eukprot:TRINITY_DN3337_c0_g1_i1.p1 TRINITY_DN3337_c0_g1~~TRINITY_DN3337_c0_g1_i1.p1  ORF type:complete len:357 (+),score=76.50 TRINITY_DN3337_c0_g1_i1:56-1126(+)
MEVESSSSSNNSFHFRAMEQVIPQESKADLERIKAHFNSERQNYIHQYTTQFFLEAISSDPTDIQDQSENIKQHRATIAERKKIIGGTKTKIKQTKNDVIKVVKEVAENAKKVDENKPVLNRMETDNLEAKAKRDQEERFKKANKSQCFGSLSASSSSEFADRLTLKTKEQCEKTAEAQKQVITKMNQQIMKEKNHVSELEQKIKPMQQSVNSIRRNIEHAKRTQQKQDSRFLLLSGCNNQEKIEWHKTLCSTVRLLGGIEAEWDSNGTDLKIDVKTKADVNSTTSSTASNPYRFSLIVPFVQVAKSKCEFTNAELHDCESKSNIDIEDIILFAVQTQDLKLLIRETRERINSASL